MTNKNTKGLKTVYFRIAFFKYKRIQFWWEFSDFQTLAFERAALAGPECKSDRANVKIFAVNVAGTTLKLDEFNIDFDVFTNLPRKKLSDQS